MKLASHHAVTGKESVLCLVATLKMQFCEADLPAQDNHEDGL